MSKIRIGMMGFGRVGRQIYRLALADDRYEVVAVSDIGRPEILHHLLTKSMGSRLPVRLESNYLICQDEGSVNGAPHRTRLLPADKPAEIPWDVLGADLVIDTTARFRSSDALSPHLDNGVRRVILSTLPEGEIDRVVLFGVNQDSIDSRDRIVSAGSASTTAMALALKVIAGAGAIEHATMTSVHAYTSDQILQDYAGPDYRRSRSGATNIIPNETPAPHWVERLMPGLAGKLSGFALNVPVQAGSLLDLTVAFADEDITPQAVNGLFLAAAAAEPELIATTGDPIVSSDVKGCSQSILVDLKGTLKAGSKLIKVLAWHESLGHARRILDLAALYAGLDGATSREAA
ncbi:MAG: glyceraldehyde-3-phosphate dehydrogenase [Gammaproteobacteria bacterium]|nr:glyceraldehyde-3-phosphate dehydrogenase [Gammaproteobacteria bacterium]